MRTTKALEIATIGFYSTALFYIADWLLGPPPLPVWLLAAACLTFGYVYGQVMERRFVE